MVIVECKSKIALEKNNKCSEKKNWKAGIILISILIIYKMISLITIKQQEYRIM